MKNSYHYDTDSIKLFLKVNDTNEKNLNKMFSITDALDLSKTDKTEDETKDVIAAKSNLRLQNGIYITPEEGNPDDKKFYLQALSYNEELDKLTSTSKDNRITDIRFKQYYDNSNKDEEILYFISYQNKLLYLEEDSDNKIILKKLEMNDICKYHGNDDDDVEEKDQKFQYKGNESLTADTNTIDDLYFNRNYNTIPLENICPKDYPIACSGDVNWRNHCTKDGKDDITGKCNSFNDNNITIKINSNDPMRNFKCNGFKCLDTSITNDRF